MPKKPAKCIAQSIGMLTVLRYHFDNEVPIHDVRWEADYAYNPDAGQKEMQEKIKALPDMDVPRLVETRISELQTATSWLEELGKKLEGLPGVAFAGAYVCLADSIAHFEHRLRAIKKCG